MAALARQLQSLLWTACKKKEWEKEAEEEEEEAGRRAPDGPRSLLTAPRRAQQPHGGAAASWGLRFGASAAQGWRARMEDAHCTWLSLPGLPPGWAFFAVLDGHGGARAARFGARHLPGHVLEELGPEPGEPEGVREALRRAFLSADERLRSLWPHVETGGSTAVALLVSPRFLYLAHCGDSRAVLSRAGAVAFSTEDHRPLRPRERERIHAAGGTIRRRRVEGSLAVSRALGDFAYKQAPGRPPELQLVSAEPEVTALGSLDNMTCILVCFTGAPRPSEEAIRRELALDAALGRRIAELCACAQELPSLNTVFRTLALEDIPDLPPGGGLDCKATVIAEAYSKFCQVSEECRENGQDGAGKPTATDLGSALDMEA
ncbi:probable protein phosphatase 1N isoform X2 [Cebus imitator]|uniref:probable protein phosphatase 1N isoform X2 n=1 Tax=Cebus imitator TaxID=2715852 RepID=UPI00189998C6|nr:probable protein phosphatase 1N isoform X2 [Cebus imitator]